MASSYFSPNSKISGGCLFVSFNSKDAAVYFKLLPQVANNPDKKNNFDGKNPLHVKLSEDEAADIIRAVRTNGISNFYHSYNEDKTTGRFNYYELDSKDKEGKPAKRRGFGLTVNKNGKEVKIGFTLASAERLSEYLKFSLTHIFSADYAADKKKSEEYLKKKKEEEANKLNKSKNTSLKNEYLPSEEESKSSEVEKENKGEENLEDLF